MKDLFTKSLLGIYLASFILLASCFYSDGEEPPHPVSQSSSSKASSSSIVAEANFRIKNESGFALSAVKWNGTDFGDIQNSGAEERIVSTGNGKISFTIVSKNMDVTTFEVIGVETASDVITLTPNTLVEELNGLDFANVKSLKNITKTISTKILGKWLDESDPNEDEIYFDGNGTGFNDWWYVLPEDDIEEGKNCKGESEGYKFKYIATENKIEIIVTEVHWTERCELLSSKDLEDLSWLTIEVPINNISQYEITEDGKLFIINWNRNYTKQ